jgi:hypothetical protein
MCSVPLPGAVEGLGELQTHGVEKKCWTVIRVVAVRLRLRDKGALGKRLYKRVKAGHLALDGCMQPGTVVRCRPHT